MGIPTKTYTELCKLNTFIERYRYLKLEGKVGVSTFGFNRYLNQVFYKSSPWLEVRDFVILRDNGMDLGIDGYPISGKVQVHHMGEISEDDILNREDWILDPEYLIASSLNTHNAIHYGDETLLIADPVVRMPNDTCPWR